MSDLLHRVEGKIQDHGLLARGDAVIAAVSGGVDSVVLLHVLHALSIKHRWKLTVAHFNHLLRGKESDGDEAFVARMAGRLGLPFESSRGDVRAMARQRKISIEMAARALRHEFLAATAREVGTRRIALAHHADDQLELFFLRLFRGAGPEGLAGMKWMTPSPVDWDLALVRPLLAETKPELIHYARAMKLRFRDDRSNRSSDILRNRIRNKLLPQLRRDYQPELHRTVLRAMDLLGAEAEYLDETAEAWLRKRGRKEWASLPVAVQRAVLHSELLRLGIRPQFEWVEQLRMEGGWTTIAPNFACRRKPDGTLEKRAHETPRETAPADALIILGGRRGTVEFAGRRFRWQLRPGSSLPRRREATVECFDAAAVGERVLLRHWRAGDRFQLIGMTKASKLQDLFVNQKIARARRHRLVVATTARGDIFWVEGLRIGERCKVQPGTKEILRWQWEAIS